jgi:hypothetical protein
MNPNNMPCNAVHFKYQQHGEQYISRFSTDIESSMSITQVCRMLQDGGGWIIDRKWFPNSRVVEVRFS